MKLVKTADKDKFWKEICFGIDIFILSLYNITKIENLFNISQQTVILLNSIKLGKESSNMFFACIFVGGYILYSRNNNLTHCFSVLKLSLTKGHLRFQTCYSLQCQIVILGVTSNIYLIY